MRASEEQLRAMMIGGLQGDATAHRSLLTALAPQLRSFFSRRMPGGEADAEDLVQETLIAIHTRRTSYDRNRPFMPWVYAVARHKLADYFRKRKLDVALEDLAEILVSENLADTSAAGLDVDRLLLRLPPKQASVIRGTKIEGLSIAEAARRDGLSQSDVKISVHRGMKALSRLLGRN